MANVYDANFKYDWSSDLPRIKARTLVLELAAAGEVERHGFQGEWLTGIVPDSTWVSVDGADDGIFYESQVVATHVDEFLQG